MSEGFARRLHRRLISAAARVILSRNQLRPADDPRTSQR
jgi:hypothetical protein